MEREKLAFLLERMDQGDTQAERDLLDYIMQQPEGIRVLAFEALEQGGDDTFDQLMLTLADDPTLTIRSSSRRPTQVAQGTAENRPPTPASTSPSEATVPEDLLAALRGGDRSRRIQATRALGQYKSPNAIVLLIDAVRSGDRMVAAAAVESLQEIGAAGVPAVSEALTATREDQARWSLVKVLSAVGDERAIPTLMGALEEKNYGTRWLAAEGLARIGRPVLVPLLRQVAETKASTWLRDGVWHIMNKINLPDDQERAFYKQLGAELKRTSAANLPHIARQELRRLGQDA